MAGKHQPQLTWIGKEQRPGGEPHCLRESVDFSYRPLNVANGQFDENRLIFGDNLLALRALEPEFTGTFKCIYIDPPFNTGQSMEHYHDGAQHSRWLAMMRDRLEVLRRLLKRDGTLFVHIDDNELGYLMVLMDELLGRSNRMNLITFKQGSATGHKAINPGCVSTTNYILIYAKDKSAWSPRRLFTARQRDRRYNQFIRNPQCHHSQWQITTLMSALAETRGFSDKEAKSIVKASPGTVDAFVLEHADNVVQLARPNYQAVSQAARWMIDRSKAAPDQVFLLQRKNHPDMYFKGGQRILFYRHKLKLVDGKWVAGEPLTTLWDDIHSNNLHKEGAVRFPKGKKPEALIRRILELSTDRGDWVLDSFAGSGTTGAVAHKLGRRWVMVESGDHCHTHVIPRLKRVMDGADRDGISKLVDWKGGGGFRYYTLS